jgi:nucleotide-binding universal stress UspA family protein
MKKKKEELGMNSSIFKKIMVATDGSELTKKAVDSAIEITKLNEAKLYAVHVVAPGDFSITQNEPKASITQNEPRDAEWKKEIKEHLTTQGKEATAYVENVGKAANIEVESVILEGNPADEIVDFAEKNEIDLIVMGTLGKTGIKRFLLGSVAENVVRHSKKAVLVVRGD